MHEDSVEPVLRFNAADLILGPSLEGGRSGDTALLCGETAVSFGELDSLSRRVASVLGRITKGGDRVLMLLKDSPVFVAAFLGIMRCGCVAVPLNTRLAPRDLAFVLRDSEASVLLIDAEFLPVYLRATEESRASSPLVVVRGSAAPGTISLEDWFAESVPEAESDSMANDDMAFWLYSSGTTGTPKAAIHCHGDVLTGEPYMRMLGLGPGERVFASSKLFFSFALGHTILGGLRAGATVVLYEPWPEAAAIAEVVERHRPTVMLSVPTLFRNLLRDGFAARAGFRSVRTYVSAGEALPVSLYRRWLAETGAPIVEGIGATETIFMFVSGTVAEHRPGATGKPMPYAEVMLLDSSAMPIESPDVAGIAWVKLPSLCRGYWREPDKTRATFQDGWFRTGDMFSVDAEGWWHHHGRSDDLLKISGQWVSPVEIEECAVSVPGVAEAAVVSVENDDDLVRMTLYLVADSGTAAAGLEQLAEAVQRALRSTLSIYKCPRDVRFIEAIPRTATGKVQRYLLRRIAMQEKTEYEIQA